MRAPRFTGIGTFMRLPNVVDMTGVDAAFIGIPFDTAVSYRIGGRFGPAAIREASRLLRPYNVEQDVDIFELVSAVDAGDLSVIPGNVQATYAVIEEGLIDTTRAVQLGIRGSLYGPADRDGARALGLHLIPTETLLERGIGEVLLEVLERVGKGPVFLSFDIDFVDPGFAPGTGTPEVGGPTSRDALRLVRGLRGLDLVGFDLVEVQPQYDHGEVTSLLAGTLLHEFLTLVALNRPTL